MDFNINQKFQSEVTGYERILWTGQPKKGIIFRGSDTLMIPFSLLWGGFAIFWEVTAFIGGAPPFVLLFGSFFVIMGLYLIFGRFIYDALKRKNNYYAITNERILILDEFPSKKLKSLNLKTLTDISMTEKSDNSGLITFGPQHPMASWTAGMAWPGMGQTQSPMFDSIDEVKEVYNKIRDAQRNL